MKEEATKKEDRRNVDKRETPRAPMRLVAARVLKGTTEGSPLLPMCAEASEDKSRKNKTLKLRWRRWTKK